MHFEVPHKFTQAEAVSRIKNALAQGKAQVAGKLSIEKEEWDGNTLAFAFTAEKQHITGTVAVGENAYVIDAKLPFMLRMFEGRIEKMIGEQVQALS